MNRSIRDENPFDGDWSLYGFQRNKKQAPSPSLDEPRIRLQALVSLCDNKKEDGGFYIVPGTVHHIRDWADLNRSLAPQYSGRNFVPVPKDDKILYPNVQEISLRKGALVVWS